MKYYKGGQNISTPEVGDILEIPKSNKFWFLDKFKIMLASISLISMKLLIPTLLILIFICGKYYYDYISIGKKYNNKFTGILNAFQMNNGNLNDLKYNIKKDNVNMGMMQIGIILSLLMILIVTIIIFFRHSLKNYAIVLIIESLIIVLSYILFEIFFHFVFSNNYKDITKREIIKIISDNSKS